MCQLRDDVCLLQNSQDGCSSGVTEGRNELVVKDSQPMQQEALEKVGLRLDAATRALERTSAPFVEELSSLLNWHYPQSWVRWRTCPGTCELGVMRFEFERRVERTWQQHSRSGTRLSCPVNGCLACRPWNASRLRSL